MTLFLAILILCLIAEITSILIYYFYSKRYHLINNTETSRITTLKKGFYEIKGKVTFLTEKLISPMAQVPCIYYKLKIEELRNSGKSSSWHTIIKDEKYVRFGVQDSSGTAYIELKGAKLAFKKDIQGKTGLFNKASDELERVMNNYGKSTHRWIFDKTLRYEETIIGEAEELYVIGEVTDMEGYYPVYKKGKLPFLISDKSEESILQTSKKIFRIALLFMISIPLCLLVYFLFYLDLFPLIFALF